MPEYRFDGQELRRRRVAAGMRREHVAIAINRNAETITNWELGRAVPAMETAMMLCDLLDCQPGDLFVPVPEPKAVAENNRLKSRRAQGLPDKITNPAALDDAAALLSPRR